jgi:hypothetical protein
MKSHALMIVNPPAGNKRGNDRSIRLRFIGLLAALVVCILAFQSAPASAAAGQNALYIGQRLNSGQYLANGPHLAQMGYNGNFVLYKNGSACWSTGTAGRGDYRSYIIMQGDGNLVIYAYAGGPALWASNTTAFRGGHLELLVGVRLGLWITNNSTFTFPIALC